MDGLHRYYHIYGSMEACIRTAQNVTTNAVSDAKPRGSSTDPIKPDVYGRFHIGNYKWYECRVEKFRNGQTEDLSGYVMSRSVELKRIFDIDPAKGRSLILRDLSDPNDAYLTSLTSRQGIPRGFDTSTLAQPSIELAKLLSPEELQPVVQQAVQRIVTAQRRTSPFERVDVRPLDYSLVEMFGDKSALGALEANFKVSDDRLPCVGYVAPMLRYFLRVDSMFGARQAQAALEMRHNGVRCYPHMLQDLGPSLPKVEQLAITALDDPDPEVSITAADALRRWGTAKAEPALWARLKRFHEEWHDREGELRITPENYRSPIARAAWLEQTLLSAIVSGTNWICGPEKFDQLRALTSPQHWTDLSWLTEAWESSDEAKRLLVPTWLVTRGELGPEDQLSFSVLQYDGLDEEQIRTKLSQMPRGSKFYFVLTADRALVSMERQQAVFQGLRQYAAQFGVTIGSATSHRLGTSQLASLQIRDPVG